MNIVSMARVGNPVARIMLLKVKVRLVISSPGRMNIMKSRA